MPSPIIEKLQKLIAHERSARSIGNQEEAEAFAERIQELLTKHKLEMSEIDFKTRETGEPVDWERVSGDELAGSKVTQVWWRAHLANAIARVNSCEMVLGATNTSFFFVGRTSDRHASKIFYIYLVELAEELSSKDSDREQDQQKIAFCRTSCLSSVLWREWLDDPWTKNKFSHWMQEYRKSWKNGFGESVGRRLKERYEAELAKNADVASGAIVHIKRDTLAVQDALKGKIKEKTQAVRSKNVNGDGYTRGRNVGDAVNLSPNNLGSTSTKELS